MGAWIETDLLDLTLTCQIFFFYTPSRNLVLPSILSFATCFSEHRDHLLLDSVVAKIEAKPRSYTFTFIMEMWMKKKILSLWYTNSYRQWYENELYDAHNRYSNVYKA